MSKVLQVLISFATIVMFVLLSFVLSKVGWVVLNLIMVPIIKFLLGLFVGVFVLIIVIGVLSWIWDFVDSL